MIYQDDLIEYGVGIILFLIPCGGSCMQEEAQNLSLRIIDVAVFAHNEEQSIGSILEDLAAQSILECDDYRVRIKVLCNGCTDDTALIAQEALASNEKLGAVARVESYEEPGKSRTWNRFVSELEVDSNFVVFVDGDVRVRDHRALRNLIEDLEHEDADAITSRPLKDLSRLKSKPLLRLASRMIVREHKDGPIAGSLYAVKTNVIRSIRLPIPCLVEDGFLSACIKTRIFSCKGDPGRVRASSKVQHYFCPPTSLREFFRHDVRLAVGVELNAAFYSELWAASPFEEKINVLNRLALSEGIEDILDKHLEHPERSALKSGRAMSRLRNSFSGQSSSVLKLPIRVAYAIYMELVRLRARKLFRERSFQW